MNILQSYFERNLNLQIFKMSELIKFRLEKIKLRVSFYFSFLLSINEVFFKK